MYDVDEFMVSMVMCDQNHLELKGDVRVENVERLHEMHQKITYISFTISPV